MNPNSVAVPSRESRPDVVRQRTSHREQLRRPPFFRPTHDLSLIIQMGGGSGMGPAGVVLVAAVAVALSADAAVRSERLSAELAQDDDGDAHCRSPSL